MGCCQSDTQTSRQQNYKSLKSNLEKVLPSNDPDLSLKSILLLVDTLEQSSISTLYIYTNKLPPTFFSNLTKRRNPKTVVKQAFILLSEEQQTKKIDLFFNIYDTEVLSSQEVKSVSQNLIHIISQKQNLPFPLQTRTSLIKLLLKDRKQIQKTILKQEFLENSILHPSSLLFLLKNLQNQDQESQQELTQQKFIQELSQAVEFLNQNSQTFQQNSESSFSYQQSIIQANLSTEPSPLRIERTPKSFMR